MKRSLSSYLPDSSRPLSHDRVTYIICALSAMGLITIGAFSSAQCVVSFYSSDLYIIPVMAHLLKLLNRDRKSAIS